MTNFFKTKIAGEQLLDGAVKRQNLDTSIVSDIDTLKQNDITKASDIAQLQTDLSAEESARVSGDAALGIRVDGVEGDLASEVARAQSAEAQVLSDANSYTNTKVADLVNSAPAVLDTLKELADALGSDPEFATTVANNIGAVASDLADEITRAQGAEAGLSSDISAETVRAMGVEAGLASDIADEETRALAAEAGLASDISAEEVRALAAEAGLSSDITAEVTRAQGAETQLSNSLSSEVTRALAAEGVLQSNVDAEVTRALAAEAALGVRVDGVESDISAEEVRALAAEGVLQSNVDAEETRALAAEAALGVRVDGVESDISAEEVRAQGAETALSGRVDVLEQDPTTKTYVDQKVADLVNSAPAVLDTLKELADAIGEDPNFSATISGMVGTVSADLATEVTRAQGAEAELASDISAEEVRALAAEGVLQSNVDAEETRALAAEAALGVRVDGVESDITAEETRALAAEAELASDISAEEVRALAAEAGLASDIAAEETRALAAEAELASDISAEEVRALAAEAELSSDIAAEVTTRQSADVTLQGNIDAEEVRALAAEGVLQGNIDAEETRAMGVEAGLASDIASEVSAREGADTALSSRISVLESDATTKAYVDQKFAEVVDNAPAVLDTLNELAQAIGDDPAFITNISASIDAAEASVAAEETRALAAEAGLASDISAEEVRALAAEAALDVEIEALDGRITTLEDSVYIIREVPSGSVNNTNTVFQLSSTPTSGSEQVFLNGLLQEAGVSGDYTISGDTITFGVAPKTGYALFVNYVTGAPVFNLGSGSSSGFSGDYNDLINKPSLFSGSYNDLTNKPTIALAGHQWSANHTLADGTRYLAGDIVYDNGNIYVAKFDNESMPTSSDVYWQNLGAGKRINIDGRDIQNIQYSQLSGKPSLFSGSYNDLSDKPAIPSIDGLATETYVDAKVAELVSSAPAALDTLNELAQAINDDPSFAATVASNIGAIASRVTTLEGVSFATVATSGSYTDLTNKPTLFSGSYTDLTNKPTLFSGSYTDLTNKPTVPSTLDDLSDVVITSASKGQLVAHNGTSFVNTNTLEASAASVKPLILKGAASQSANLFETQNSSGTTLTYINSSGLLNTYLGYVNNLYVGYRNASRNTFLGERAGESNAINANDSVAIGFEASRYNSSGYENVVIGKSAMGAANSTAYRNTAVGFFAGAYMTSGSANTLMGHLAANAITTGSSNVVIGKDAATTITTGSLNVAIGAGSTLSITDSNQIAIGYGATTSGASALALGVSASAAANCMDIRFGGASRITGDSSGNVAVTNTLHAKRYTETVANAFNSSLAPASGTLTVDTSTGNCVLGALNASVSTWAFTNVPTDNSKVTTVTTVVAGNASYTYGDACSVNGTSVSGGIMWSGGTAPTSTAGTDIITFIIVKDSAGTVKVFGSATTNFS